MKLYKKLLLNLFKQLQARKNLIHLRDKRAIKPFLGLTLLEAARTWPEYFPWKWKPRTVMDIGAYNGRVAAGLAALYQPDFIGLVEPQPEMIRILGQFSLAPKQKIFPCALGREQGRAKLNRLASAASSTLLEPAAHLESEYRRDMSIFEAIDVEIRTLDDILEECEITNIDLMKIDVEGYELEVFAGGTMALRRTSLIVVEAAFFEAQKGRPLFKDIYEYLAEKGFELIGTHGFSCNPEGLPLHCDAVFINKFLKLNYV